MADITKEFYMPEGNINKNNRSIFMHSPESKYDIMAVNYTKDDRWDIEKLEFVYKNNDLTWTIGTSASNSNLPITGEDFSKLPEHLDNNPSKEVEETLKKFKEAAEKMMDMVKNKSIKFDGPDGVSSFSVKYQNSKSQMNVFWNAYDKDIYKFAERSNKRSGKGTITTFNMHNLPDFAERAFRSDESARKFLEPIIFARSVKQEELRKKIRESRKRDRHNGLKNHGGGRDERY